MYRCQKTIEQINALGFHAFTHDGKYVKVSLEYGDDAGDYYGEFRGGYPWINPKLERLAKAKRAYWEWENAACITLYPE